LAEEAHQPAIKQAADSINSRMVDFNVHFVSYNKENVVGKFVYKLMNSTFTTEQKISLDIKSIN